ncbi:PREDICTED: uncharacterized protein LOC104803578 [Tarenaya hassleriana]|uniref:uncharacterized protein LOC104803578 n=1 Tax=Tarenaya hassleriana TaxID=28532 RepID=UPI00053C7F09|nr:PREDICTED: uncharacterized protein LOC104803578 [Tarenaya hassleriana]XP_010525840.1 PREDICTED: uncharacterized protein LOC104803578 [Tarenaya hassleriana]
MDFFDEWKSHVRRDSNPLCLIPSGEIPGKFSDSDFQILFSSPSLCPPLLSPLPHLSLPRFLSTAAAVPPSASSYIAAKFGHMNPHEDALPMLSYNRLQILPCPGKKSVLVFFPTGINCDQVGFLVLSVGDSGFRVVGSEERDVLVAKERFFSRILRILVKPVDESDDSFGNLGYVMVYTLYSVHWYCVKHGGSEEKPVLRYLGCKRFKSCSIASASWSQHLHGECLVLLENGSMFLFDVSEESNGYFCGNRVKVPWGDQNKSEKCCWLGCQFSWHPRIFIAARSDAVFLVDTRSDKCSLTRLMVSSCRTEQFLTFSSSDTEGFQFILASRSLLFLCDVRISLSPLLQWSHDVSKPCFIDVYSLSELKLGTESDKRADGSCIILGSLWNSEFSMFYCGSYTSADEESDVPRVGNDSGSLYVQELPCGSFFSGQCSCGDCILRENIMKDTCHDWIDWQKKKEIILGFGVLNKFLQLNSDQFPGFTFIRITSSGKLEVNTFRFSWDSLTYMKEAHGHLPCESDKESLLYLTDYGEYKFPKRFKYLELDYICAYMNGNLAELLDSRMRTSSSGSGKEKPFSLEAHEALCEKLKICGFGRDRISPAIAAVFDGIRSPTSIFEIALKQTWASLPTELLLLAYSNYSEFQDVLLNLKRVSLEFLVVPDLPQLPPFLLRKPSCRSSKWTCKNLPTDELVGPVLPLPVLLTLHEICNGSLNSQEDPCGFSPEAEFSHQCDQVSQVARDVVIFGSDSEVVQRDEHKSISLGDDHDDARDDNSQKQKPFIAYRPFTGSSASACEDGAFSMFISRVQGKESVVEDKMGSVGPELFDLSPVILEFEHRDLNFNSQELGKTDLHKFEVQFSQWQNQFTPFQEFLSQYNLQM